ncbi:MAG TPA: adenine phosphoribosyltransferase [Chthoniobacteraceae bacterium]|nr:adenine phosphoribosyltransferase [Chthoniobacteraceae bacterium]
MNHVPSASPATPLPEASSLPASQQLLELQNAIRAIPDFPKPGIIFRDITPVLEDRKLFRNAIDQFVDLNRSLEIDKVVGIDARGFLFGAAAAYALNVGFVPVRKKGKLPYSTKETTYDLEYGTATVEIHVDGIRRNERVVLIDDLLATGGTAAAAVELIAHLGGCLLSTQFLVELDALNGRKRLEPHPVHSFLHF